MGIRGELFSTTVALQNRTYFFNVKENRLGDLYLNIVESKNRDTGGFDRQSVILFADDLTEFLQGFDESLKVLEKAVKEKRRAAPRKAPESRGDGEGREDRPPRKASPGGTRSDGAPAKRFRSKQERPDSPTSRGRKETGKAAGSGKTPGRKPAAGKTGPRKPGASGAGSSRPAPRGRVVVRKRDRDE
ncbi:conserved hypothetical protein [Treponema primitia ZAS-2]|uniref:DNA-binding protein n=1 Tax=Treponema primitia (strain ATCC BAA-887 / DSM 12427 / ZAS-2) TaxID=545694 RepID=F5YQK9_TREPZ|nr:DUF3276 family protein [Treponema primitia]AEF85511.1 conserved hypothetical protein [Treponema primitia ZAS-2]